MSMKVTVETITLVKDEHSRLFREVREDIERQAFIDAAVFGASRVDIDDDVVEFNWEGEALTVTLDGKNYTITDDEPINEITAYSKDLPSGLGDFTEYMKRLFPENLITKKAERVCKVCAKTCDVSGPCWWCGN